MTTHDDLGHEGRKDLSEIFRAKGSFSAYYMRETRLAQAKLTEKRRRRANWRNCSRAIDRGRHRAGAPRRQAALRAALTAGTARAYSRGRLRSSAAPHEGTAETESPALWADLPALRASLVLASVSDGLCRDVGSASCSKSKLPERQRISHNSEGPQTRPRAPPGKENHLDSAPN